MTDGNLFQKLVIGFLVMSVTCFAVVAILVVAIKFAAWLWGAI